MDDVLWAQSVAEKIRNKMAWVAEKNKNKIPYTTDREGNYNDMSDPNQNWPVDSGLNWWTNGFWGGLMWLMYQDTGDKKYQEAAVLCEQKLEKCLEPFYGLHHDVGFMFVLTAVADYQLTGNPVSRRTALHAATLLAGRFNPMGRFIRAWNVDDPDTRGWAIIDCMFNLSLLYWAAEETGDPRFRHVAMMHADTVMKNFIREDGSSNHIMEFDPETGTLIRSYGGQGYEDGSAWTRGQGWALYGFMISYRHTGKKEYLETARKVADFCVAHIPESGIIPADFCQPPEPAYEDSCAGCVIAGGLLELAENVGTEEKEKYRRMAVRILSAIDTSRANWGTDCDAIVQNCSGSYHGEPHHIPMNYADYYFAEAIYKLAGIGRFMW